MGRTQWFRAAIGTGRFVLGDYASDPLAGTGALVAAQPLPTGPRRSKMVMFAGIDTRSLGEAASFHEPARNTTVVLFDGHGTVLARVPPLAGAVGRRLPDQPLVSTVLHRHQGTAEAEGLDGVERIQGFAPVTGVGGAELYVAAGRPSSVVYADPDNGPEAVHPARSHRPRARPAARATSPRSSCSSAGPPESSSPRAASARATSAPGLRCRAASPSSPTSPTPSTSPPRRSSAARASRRG